MLGFQLFIKFIFAPWRFYGQGLGDGLKSDHTIPLSNNFRKGYCGYCDILPET